MTLSGNVDALATRLADEFNDVRGEVTTALAGKAATSHTHAAADVASGTLDIARIPTGTSGTTVAFGNHAHAGADITSGTVAYARLPVGTAASTVAAGNDSRFTDARTPTAHTHAAADVTSGTIDAARLPAVLSPVRTVSFSATPTIDPTVSGTNVSITATGDITALAVSTTGAVNRQGLEIAVLGSGGARAVTFASAIRTSTGVTRGPHSIASGEIGIFLVRYYTLISAWVLVAATVSAT